MKKKSPEASCGPVRSEEEIPAIDGEPFRIPVDGVLDLHIFAPRDVPSVVKEYLGECRERGIYDVRIIHGKGKGVLLRTVHALLERDARVLTFGLDTGPASWGATLVRLKEW